MNARPNRLRRAAHPTFLCLGLAGACLLSGGALSAQDRDPGTGFDPPNRVARIAYAQGNVSLEPAGFDSFAAAELNYPLTNGDRVYDDLNALSELQTSGLAVRLANGADLTITALTDNNAQFALAQGSARLQVRDLYAPPAGDGSPQQGNVEVDTPNTTINVLQPGDIRIDFYPTDSSTVVTVNSGAVALSGPGFNQNLGPNQSMRLTGIGSVDPEYVGLLPPDPLDEFAARREQTRLNSVAFRNHYVDPEMIGAADLDQYGDWSPSPQYGPVWFPRAVGGGWSPYSVGHWANVYPWGYTWVDEQPWGFAPFHYGRWNNFGGRWGWIPGPPPSVFRGGGWGGPPPRPVYSPALVAFVGGNGFSITIGGGVGVTAWFPLGPSEPYTPWYRTTPAYVNRVNVTNIYTTNVTEIHNTYINRSTTVYNTNNVTYVNRTNVVAVNQRDFAAGHSVARSTPVPINSSLRTQLVSAPVLTHAVAPPPRTAPPIAIPAKVAPPVLARPVVQTRQGFQRAGAPPASAPLRAPVAPPASAPGRAPVPQPRPVQAIAPPRGAAPIDATRPVAPGTITNGSARPMTPGAPAPTTQPAPIERNTPRPGAPTTPPGTPPNRIDQAPPRAYPTPPPVNQAPLRPSETPRTTDQAAPRSNLSPTRNDQAPARTNQAPPRIDQIPPRAPAPAQPVPVRPAVPAPAQPVPIRPAPQPSRPQPTRPEAAPRPVTPAPVTPAPARPAPARPVPGAPVQIRPETTPVRPEAAPRPVPGTSGRAPAPLPRDASPQPRPKPDEKRPADTRPPDQRPS